MLGLIIVNLPDGIDLNECIANVVIIWSRTHFHRHHRKIKALPSPRNTVNVNEVFHGYECIGWNNCLSEILGETE